MNSNVNLSDGVTADELTAVDGGSYTGLYDGKNGVIFHEWGGIEVWDDGKKQEYFPTSKTWRTY
jgi:hypothetical protein